MAIISTIRNNSWVLIVLIGLGLFGFLIMDMFSGDTSVMGSGATQIGSIDGTPVDVADLNRRESIYNFIYGGNQNPYATKEFLWNHIVEEKIMKEKAEQLGLGVSRDELLELEFGQTLSPIIQSRFSDPQTRQVNRENLNQFKQAIETSQLPPQQRQYWAYQETEIIKQQLQDKYARLISQAAYTPNWLNELNKEISGKSRKVAYVKLPFDQAEYEGSISDEDIEAYMEENRNEFYSDSEQRKLTLLNISVEATSEDSAAIYRSLAGLKQDFANAENVSLFAERNDGNMDPGYFTKDELNPGSADTLFNMEIGTVYGPFIENGQYKLIRLVDKKIIPDSVKSRHILIQANAGNYAQAQKTIDSLKNLIETGQSRFDSLASQFGMDATAQSGGDLGYTSKGRMVKEFNDLIFFESEVGPLYTVSTQFGIHLVQVMDKKFITNSEAVQIATITSPIVPSDETQDESYRKAQEIMRDHRDLTSLQSFINENPEYLLSESRLLKVNDYAIQAVGEPQTSRDMIKWAFSASAGDVSNNVYTKQNNQYYYNSNYFIIGLKDVIPAGMPSASDIRNEIEATILNKKRGEALATQISSMSLSDAATRYNGRVDTALNVSAASTFIPGVGNEPAVVGKIANTRVGSTSAVVGNSGVYTFEVLSENPSVSPNDAFRQQRKSSISSSIMNNLMEDIKKDRNIEDNRAKFF